MSPSVCSLQIRWFSDPLHFIFPVSSLNTHTPGKTWPVLYLSSRRVPDYYWSGIQILSFINVVLLCQKLCQVLQQKFSLTNLLQAPQSLFLKQTWPQHWPIKTSTMMLHLEIYGCNLSIQEVEAGEKWIPDQPGIHSVIVSSTTPNIDFNSCRPYLLMSPEWPLTVYEKTQMTDLFPVPANAQELGIPIS